MKRLLPTGKEWHSAFNILSRKEKIVFLTLFFVTWVSGIAILTRIDSRHSTKIPARGGSLIEGVVGIPSKVNPLLAVSDVDRDLSRLIFAGLMKSNGHGGLERELADSYEISDDGLTYTFHLRQGLVWHDNQPLTADDVAFTVNLAKNPKIESPKRANWEGVTVQVTGDRDIVFHLRKPYAPFLENTTLGILPKHLWDHTAPEEFKLSALNIHPIGAGPFEVASLDESTTGSITQYSLERFSRYQPQAAYLDSLEIMIFASTNDALKALREGTIQSLAGVPEAANTENTTTLEIRLPRIFGVFFNQDNFKPLQDSELRQALALAIDRDRIIKEATGGRAIATSLPVPPGTFAYAQDLDNPIHDVEAAKALLKKAGYVDTDGDGIIEKVVKKEKTPIRFTIATSNTDELTRTAQLIKAMWREIGVDVTVETFEIGDLEQSIIRPRNYASLLFGQVVGYDPDPFAFWHASQRNDPGLNIALYANTKVNKILEDARTTIDATKRSSLYHDFQQELQKDNPAIFLYSPLYVYTIPEHLYGVELSQIPLPQERFSDITKWHVYTRNIWNILR